MRKLITILALVAVCGCRSQNSFSEWRADDKRFTPREREVVSAARSYLEHRFATTVDGYYRVSETQDGYSVLVWFATGYEHGQPMFSPGGFGIVELHKDLTVADYLPGH